MSDEIRIYGVEMKAFNYEDIIASLWHDPHCTVEDKTVFNRGDKLVGTVHREEQNKNYLIYSCFVCGGLYALEGEVPRRVKKGL